MFRSQLADSRQRQFYVCVGCLVCPCVDWTQLDLSDHHKRHRPFMALKRHLAPRAKTFSSSEAKKARFLRSIQSTSTPLLFICRHRDVRFTVRQHASAACALTIIFCPSVCPYSFYGLIGLYHQT